MSIASFCYRTTRYTYELHADQALASVSLTTVAFAGAAEGDVTELTLTEQIAALDGRDTAAARERGMRFLLDRLGDLLAQTEQA